MTGFSSMEVIGSPDNGQFWWWGGTKAWVQVSSRGRGGGPGHRRQGISSRDFPVKGSRGMEWALPMK